MQLDAQGCHVWKLRDGTVVDRFHVLVAREVLEDAQLAFPDLGLGRLGGLQVGLEDLSMGLAVHLHLLELQPAIVDDGKRRGSAQRDHDPLRNVRAKARLFQSQAQELDGDGLDGLGVGHGVTR